MSTATRERVRKVGEIENTKGDRSIGFSPNSLPPRIIDLTQMTDEKVPMSIYARGEALWRAGRVRRNTIYPWKFTVSGSEGEDGVVLYFIDLSFYTCSCSYFEHREKTCKHLIAALLTCMADERGTL